MCQGFEGVVGEVALEYVNPGVAGTLEICTQGIEAILV